MTRIISYFKHKLIYTSYTQLNSYFSKLMINQLFIAFIYRCLIVPYFSSFNISFILLNLMKTMTRIVNYFKYKLIYISYTLIKQLFFKIK